MEIGKRPRRGAGASNLIQSASGLQGYGDLNSCNHPQAWASGRVVNRTYDARNRLKTLTFPDGRGNQSWSYTPDGLPDQITTWNELNSGSVVNHYVYNKRRLLTGEHVEQPNWYAWGIGYGYDANGSLATQSYPTGFLINYAPNALGQATQAGSYATGVQYYPNGAIKQFTYGNGLTHNMAQNARQLPARVTDGGNALDHDYGYDPNGNVDHIYDYIIGAPTPQHRYMTYDGLDRLTGTGLAMFGGSDHWHRFTYDALDNLKSWKHAGIKDYAEYVYDTKNQLTNIKNTAGATVVGLGYDAQGNLANKNGKTYAFDYGNRLRGTDEEWYRYDSHGRRVLNWRATEAGVLSQYSQSGQLLYDENYRASGRKATEYVYLAGSVVAMRERNVDTSVYATKYQHTDTLGSPVAVTDATGTVIDRTNYEPYGAINKPAYDGIGYTGHVMDGATGLTYMQQRYYDPGIGRFLSIDSVAANPGTGANFNRYWYANDNPYKFYDPDGRYVCTASNRVCDKIDRAVQLISKASVKPGADPRLAKISAFLGKADKVNGVSINDKVTKPGNSGEATREQNGVHIGLNMARLSTGDQVASVLVHEGSHGVDHMDPRISKQMNDDSSRSALNASELRGGEMQAKLFQALGRQEPYKLYSPTKGINWDGINSQADRSVNQMCPSAKECNP